MGESAFKNNNASFVFAPSIGKDPIVLTITSAIERITTTLTDENNYKAKGKNFGYRDVLGVEGDKKLMVNTWKLYFALKEANLEIGDSFELSHPEQGKYLVTKIG